jgi:hypothetical protein
VQGDDLAIALFLFAMAVGWFGIAITIALSDASRAGWGRWLMFGSFTVAALFFVAGCSWPWLRDPSWRITAILQQVATSPASWIILLLVVSALVWFRRRKILALLASVNQSPLLSRIPPLLFVAIIAAGGLAIAVMALSGTRPDTAAVSPPHTFGFYKAVELLGAPRRQLPQVSGGVNVIITSPSENESVKAAVKLFLEKGVEGVHFKDLPNYDVDSDAPPVPEPQFAGVRIHGRNNEVTQALRAPFAGCLIIKTTQSDIERFAQYYHDPDLVWIEFGKGSPWVGPQACSG